MNASGIRIGDQNFNRNQKVSVAIETNMDEVLHFDWNDDGCSMYNNAYCNHEYLANHFISYFLPS